MTTKPPGPDRPDLPSGSSSIGHLPLAVVGVAVMCLLVYRVSQLSI